jgi:hypothetical protein
MRHLTSEQFVDLAEGTCDEASVPHLQTCHACRRELAALRAALTIVSVADRNPAGDATEVPEPSPLFWDHFSARVRDAVANEGVPARRVSWHWSWPRVAMASAAAIAVALVVFNSNVRAPGMMFRGAPPPAPPAPVEQVETLESLKPLGSADDPSLSLVAEYGSTLDWDEMRKQMAVATHSGGTDETVADLNGGERQELQKLLKEELARPAARTDRL